MMSYEYDRAKGLMSDRKAADLPYDAEAVAQHNAAQARYDPSANACYPGRSVTPTVRDRVQEACKRTSEIAARLDYLVDAVLMPVPEVSNGAKGCESDPTLCGDLNTLLTAISLIEQRLNRLSSAITG